MFFFIKWSIIFLSFTSLIYVGSVVIDLSAKDLATIKHALKTTMASEDNKNLITALKEPLTKDWQHKKTLIIQKLNQLLNFNESTNLTNDAK